MKITTEHSMSSYGIPVILDDEGNPMDYGPGLVAVRHRLGLSRAGLAEVAGVSARTLEGWEQGRFTPPANRLYVIGKLLSDPPRDC